MRAKSSAKYGETEPIRDEGEAGRAAKFGRQMTQRWRPSRFRHQPE